MRKYVKLFLDDGNCTVYVIGQEPASSERPQGFMWAEHIMGITERNIGEFVAALTAKGYHVTLYRVGTPEFHV